MSGCNTDEFLQPVRASAANVDGKSTITSAFQRANRQTICLAWLFQKLDCPTCNSMNFDVGKTCPTCRERSVILSSFSVSSPISSSRTGAAKSCSAFRKKTEQGQGGLRLPTYGVAVLIYCETVGFYDHDHSTYGTFSKQNGWAFSTI